MAPGRSGTGPYSKFRRGIEYQLIGGRLHKNDREQLLDRLKSEGLSFTGFLQAVVSAYLSADAQLIRIIGDHKRRQKIPPDRKDTFTFSKRERQRIADKISGAPTEPEDGEAV